MKIECAVEKFKNAVLTADRMTGKNLTLPVLSTVLIQAIGKKITLRATNLSLGVEIDIPANVHKEGTVAVSGGILSNVLSTISPADTLSLELQDSSLVLSTKNTHSILKTFPYEDFPTIPSVSGSSFTIPASRFVEGIRSVYYSAAVSDVKPEISSVFVYSDDGYLVFVSTDSFRLAEKKVKVKGISDISGILIPYKNIPDIIRVFGEKEEDMTVEFSKNQISFSLDGIFMTSRIIDGVFPDYKQIIPKENATEVVLLKQDLLHAIRLSTIFMDKLSQITFSIQPGEKSIAVRSRNNDVGENETVLDGTLKGDDVEVSFNSKYLLDCFQSIPEDSVLLELNGPNKPALIKGVPHAAFTYLIMPMNR